MLRVIAFAVVVALCGSASVAAQSAPPTPQDTGALDEFMALLGHTCLEIENPQPYRPFSDIGIPAGYYCLYYTNPKAGELSRGYDFGYFNRHNRRCWGAPRTLIEGQHWDCHDQFSTSNYGPTLLPTDPALFVQLAEDDGKPTGATPYVFLWINGDWDEDYPVGPPGFHTTADGYSWNGLTAYAYTVDIMSVDCLCQCMNSFGIFQQQEKAYLVFWEAGCHSSLGQYTWRDFWVALFPAIPKQHET